MRNGYRLHMAENEKNVKLTNTFVKVSGSVFDPFAHAKGTHCVALLSSRPCTSLRKDKAVFQTGVQVFSVILHAEKLKKQFRSQEHKDRVPNRAMFKIL